MTGINFTKMQGAGNDFIIVEASSLAAGTDYHLLSAKLCDRHFGIGADGLIIINPYSSAETDTSWRIFNSDGSEPEMCGNGIRCFAKYVYDRKIVNKSEFTVSTLAGTITPKVEKSGLVTVTMGKPVLSPENVPVNLSGDKVINYPFTVLDREFRINCVSMGNPHCIIFINEDIDTTKYGPVIENHELFPRKTNVEFVRVLSRDHIKVDVWERGCGITLACGTGACACTVAAILNDYTDSRVKVSLPGGNLIIELDENTGNILMSGPAEYVFDGQIFV